MRLLQREINKRIERSSVVTAGRQIAARLKAPGRPFGVTGQRDQFLSASAEFKASRPNCASSPLCAVRLKKKSSITGQFYHELLPTAALQEIFHALFCIDHHGRRLGRGQYFVQLKVKMPRNYEQLLKEFGLDE